MKIYYFIVTFMFIWASLFSTAYSNSQCKSLLEQAIREVFPEFQPIDQKLVNSLEPRWTKLSQVGQEKFAIIITEIKFAKKATGKFANTSLLSQNITLNPALVSSPLGRIGIYHSLIHILNMLTKDGEKSTAYYLKRLFHLNGIITNESNILAEEYEFIRSVFTEDLNRKQLLVPSLDKQQYLKTKLQKLKLFKKNGELKSLSRNASDQKKEIYRNFYSNNLLEYFYVNKYQKAFTLSQSEYVRDQVNQFKTKQRFWNVGLLYLAKTGVGLFILAAL